MDVVFVVGQLGEVVFLEEQVGVVGHQFVRQFFYQLLVMGVDAAFLEPVDVLNEHGEQGQNEGDGAQLGVAVVEVDTGNGEGEEADVVDDQTLYSVSICQDMHRISYYSQRIW